MRSVIIILFFLAASQGNAQEVLLRENFKDLKNWKPLTFPKIPKHSTYTLTKEGTNSILSAASDASASGLTYKKTFSIKDYPVLKWRWKSSNVLKKGNAKTKKGDDYSIRVYVIFRYDPRKASFGLKTRYGLAKKLYGEYPPHSSLNYIWANRKHSKAFIKSPYTGRSIMIPMQQGKSNIGKWVTHEVNILKDYKKVFGEAPPDEASLAIMADSDNTGEKSQAYIDYIEIRKIRKEDK